MKNKGSVDKEISRRSLLTAAGVAGAGALGYYTGTAKANPTGTYPVSGEDPLLKIRADQIELVARQSDPSSPSDGTMWYNDSV